MNKLIKTKCAFCKKTIYRNKNTIKQNKISFCIKGGRCQHSYHSKKRDIKGYNILENIRNPNFYYLIGLICTDGNIIYPNKETKANRYSCHINLNKNDDYIIKEIIKRFGGGCFYHKTDNTIRWSLTNKNFVKYLINKVNLTHNKSETLNIKKYFNNLSEKNKRNFIRGVIDGDGCITSYKRKWGALDNRFSICSGSHFFINLLYDFFKNKFKCNKISYEDNKHNNSYSVSYYGKNILNPLNYIYKDLKINKNLIYMKRKYNLFKTLKNIYYTKEKGK